ncbi:Beta-phenylalanine transaminase [Exophiala dermatitidis]
MVTQLNPAVNGRVPNMLESLVQEAHDRYSQNNPKSLEAFKSGLAVMPGDNTRSVLHVHPFPITIARGESANLVDVDGHRYIDFLGEFSAGVYGHSSPVIKKAVMEALDKGWSFGGKNEYENQLAKLLVERFKYSMDSIRFCNSGTEANLMALGAAVNFTRKQKILVFVNGYHGSTLTFFERSPKYNLNAAQGDFVIVPYNDISATEAAVSALPADSLAAILVEPMQVSGGCIAGTRVFLQYLRDLADRQKAVLIFDEVMTSRLHYGGLQVKLDIKPDITTIGKWAGGGMSFGAFGGRGDIMAMLDPRANKLHHSGTFNNNVVTMAAGVAGCGIMDSATLDKLNARGERLKEDISRLIEKRPPVLAANNPNRDPNGKTLTFVARGIGILFVVIFLGSQRELWQALFYHHLLEQGIYIASRGFFALTIENTDQHGETLLQAISSFFDKYEQPLAEMGGP